jgi:hypothetical protein
MKDWQANCGDRGRASSANRFGVFLSMAPNELVAEVVFWSMIEPAGMVKKD